MQTAYLAFATLLLAGTALAGRDLQQTASTVCSARGNLHFVVKDGTCTGWAGASCTAFASADAVIKSQTETAFTTALCKPVQTTAAATAIAEAIARVHTTALAKISCTSVGFGCGYTASSGSAFATAFADVAVEAAAAAIAADEKLFAACQGDIRAISAAIATAFSSSFAGACVNGSGTAAAFQANFAKALSTAIASAFIKATAKVCNLPGADTAVCTLDGSGSSTTIDSVTTGQFGGSTPPSGGGFSFSGGQSGGAAFKLGTCDKFEFLNCCINNACNGVSKGASLNSDYDTVLISNLTKKSLCYCH